MPRAGRPRTRSPPAGTRSARTTWPSTLAPGESRSFTFVLGYLENPREAKWAPADEARASSRARWWRSPGRTSCSPRSPPRPRPDAAFAELHGALGPAAHHVHGAVHRREARPDGQHLEPVPVHGHVQHVALGVVLRDRDRPRHGLPRLEPGPARVRAPRARPRPRADPRHRRHPVPRRLGVPPVPAADQARQQRRRVGLQRRPAVADPRVWPGTSRRPATGRSSTRWCPSTTTRPRPRPLFEHLHPLVRVHAGQPRPARPAADRPGGLERLPEPQLLLHRARRVVPDHREPGRGHGGVGVHRGDVRGDRPGVRRRSPSAAGLAEVAARARAAVEDMRDGRAGPRLGRRVVPARVRLLRQQGRAPTSTPRARSGSSRRAWRSWAASA